MSKQNKTDYKSKSEMRRVETLKAEKWREFWINPNPDNRGWSEGKPDEWVTRGFPPIHVVEHSALEAAQTEKLALLAHLNEKDAEIERLQRMYDDQRHDIEDLFERLFGGEK